MSRVSAFRGTWEPNRRPYITMTPDVWVAIQGETSVITCGECRRRLQINRYITGISTEASIDSPPGSATINMSIPDTDVTEFYVENEFAIIPMMEVEIFAKGYYTVGGYPQYYRIFWGLVQTVSKSWSNGVTSITINCQDILRWWQLTNVITNPAFLDISKAESNYNMFGNRFAGTNPYTVILMLAKEAMGDFSLTKSSFTSFRPEDGAEGRTIGQYAKDIMGYWQLKFCNIWNSLVLYGTSGRAYTFGGLSGDVDPFQISMEIFRQEAKELDLNDQTALFKLKPYEIAAFKRDFTKAGETDFFQNDTMTKLELAMQARDQAGMYEFYCDTTGDIVFKPPFYNLNVIPNKPVSWIQDFEIIDESISDTESQVYTQVVSHGNAFGGVNDFGLNDDITTPRTGAIDWHLLKRFGWRKWDLQVEWAGDPVKLFYHCLDALDRSNAKRVSGNFQIPMRPELRMGFPVWVPSHDCFYYVSGISHQYSVGGQAVTTVTVIAKRSKFIAPKNIGLLKTTKTPKVETEKKKVAQKKQKDKKEANRIVDISYGVKDTRADVSYDISFPSDVGQSSNIIDKDGQESEYGGPAILRDPKTGKLLGFPNAVMVYRTSIEQEVLARALEGKGDTRAKNPKKQEKKSADGPDFRWDKIQGETLKLIDDDKRSRLIERIRIHRYEWGFSNAGKYDYAHDEAGEVKELNVVPANTITWGSGTNDAEPSVGVLSKEEAAKRKKEASYPIGILDEELKAIESEIKATRKELEKTRRENRKVFKGKTDEEIATDPDASARKQTEDELAEKLSGLLERREETKAKKADFQFSTSLKVLPAPNVLVRPVSDEFGFEVIGHYRYGRGAFMDRGQVQPRGAENSTINQLDIQFSAHGGLLTDNPRQRNLGPLSFNFADAYAKMQPDDYTTGASFTGGHYDSDQDIENVNPTNQGTYDAAIDKSGRLGTTVFVEADALRRARTLAELKPTIETGISDAFDNCACELGKTNWLSILPQEAIARVLAPTQAFEDDDDITIYKPRAARSRVIGESQIVRQPDPLTKPNRANTSARGVGILAGSRQIASTGINAPRRESATGLDERNKNRPVRAVAASGTNRGTMRSNSISRYYDVPGPDPWAPLGTYPTDYPVSPNDTNPNIPPTSRASDGSTNAATSTPGITSASQDHASNPPNRSGLNKPVLKGSGFKVDEFFNILNEYLVDKFGREYQENMARENWFTERPGGPRAIPRSEVSTYLSPRDIPIYGGSLFDRAAQGDPEALEEIRKGANFNFGRTSKSHEAYEQFNAKFREGGEVDFRLAEAGRRAEEAGDVINEEWPNIIAPGTERAIRIARGQTPGALAVGAYQQGEQIIAPKPEARQPQPQQENLIIREEFLANVAPEDPPATGFGGPPQLNLPDAPGQPEEVISPPEGEPEPIITELEDREVPDNTSVPDGDAYPQIETTEPEEPPEE